MRTPRSRRCAAESICSDTGLYVAPCVRYKTELAHIPSVFCCWPVAASCVRVCVCAVTRRCRACKRPFPALSPPSASSGGGRTAACVLPTRMPPIPKPNPKPHARHQQPLPHRREGSGTCRRSDNASTTWRFAWALFKICSDRTGKLAESSIQPNKPKQQGNMVNYLNPGLIAFFYMTSIFVIESIQRGEKGMDTAWMPYMWPIKSCLWFGILFLLIQGISELFKSYYAAKKGKWPDA